MYWLEPKHNNIEHEYLKGKSSVEIGKEYGVCGTTICRILKRNNITHDTMYPIEKEIVSSVVEKII